MSVVKKQQDELSIRKKIAISPSCTEAASMARPDGDLAIFGNGSLVLPDSRAFKQRSVCDAGEKIERHSYQRKQSSDSDRHRARARSAWHPCHIAS